MPLDYPRMLYAKDGRTMIVASEGEEGDAPKDFGRDPSDIHFGNVPAAVAQGDLGKTVEISGRDEFAEMVARRVVELLTETPADEAPAAPAPTPRSKKEA